MVHMRFLKEDLVIHYRFVMNIEKLLFRYCVWNQDLLYHQIEKLIGLGMSVRMWFLVVLEVMDQLHLEVLAECSESVPSLVYVKNK